MARPLRIEVSGGLYHFAAPGNERKAIYRDTRDREHLLERVAELPTRLGTPLHAYVLMNNRHHLVIETPEPNPGRVGEWLNVSPNKGERLSLSNGKTGRCLGIDMETVDAMRHCTWGAGRDG